MRRSQAALTGQFRDSGLLRVADVAMAPEKPVKPNKPVAAVAAVMLFGLCLIGVPVGWGIFDDHVMRLLRPQPPMPQRHEPVQHTPFGYGYPYAASARSLLLPFSPFFHRAPTLASDEPPSTPGDAQSAALQAGRW
jgi:hypothetical protein